MIMDAHAHIGGALISRDRSPEDALVALMEEYHTDKAIVFPIMPISMKDPNALESTKEKEFKNGWVITAIKKYPNSTLIIGHMGGCIEYVFETSTILPVGVKFGVRILGADFLPNIRARVSQGIILHFHFYRGFLKKLLYAATMGVEGCLIHLKRKQSKQ